MFGIGDEKKIQQLAGIIEGALDSFDTSLALTSQLLGKQLPEPSDKYLAILLGFADAAGQAGGVDIDITRKALQRFLGASPDGAKMFQRMMAISNDRRYFEWQMLAGRALQDAIGTKDKMAAMSKLAETYLA